MQSNRSAAANRNSEPAPSSHESKTVRIAALADMPMSERYEVPPSPRVPSIGRQRATQAGSFRGDLIKEWVDRHTGRTV